MPSWMISLLLKALAAPCWPAHLVHRVRVRWRQRRRRIASYGYYRGHLVVYFADEDDTCERYASDLTLTVDAAGVALERPCVQCGLLATPEGPDPCLGILPGVVSACCGHGVEEPYVLFRLGPPGKSPGQGLRGTPALDFFAQHGVGPPV